MVLTELPGYTETVVEDGEVVEKEFFINPSDDEIQAQATPFLYSAIDLWSLFKDFGLPSGGGWGNEKATVIEILRILEAEVRKYDAWEWEKNHPAKE